MQLKAVHRIRGVKSVIGKGAGTTVAHPGDIFEPHTNKSGESLLSAGNAVLPSQNHEKPTGAISTAVVTDADDLGGDDLSKAPAPKAPKAAAPKAAKTAAPKAKKAAASAPDVSLDDLGLGGDDGQETVVE